MYELSKEKCIDKSVQLIYDEACLDILSNRSFPVTINAQYEECLQCDMLPLVTIPPYGNTSILINTKYPLKINFNDTIQWCNSTYRYEENGIYGWNITQDSCSHIYVKQPPDNAYLPILGAFIAFLLFGTVWYGIKCIHRSGCTSNIRQRLARFSELEDINDDVLQDLGSPHSAPPTTVPVTQRRPGAGRIKSLDVFRGLAISLMIFVNYGGGQYSFFKHSLWNGLTIADLVFPWFAWIMGVSVALSLRFNLRAGVSRKRLALRALKRFVILIVLGIALNTVTTYKHHKNVMYAESQLKTNEWGIEPTHIRESTSLFDLRLPGVLQRLAISGFVVSLLEIFLMRVQALPEYGRFNFLADIFESLIQWIFVVLIVTIYLCITFLLPVPGCPLGYLGPGGLHDHSKYYNCTGGAAGYIDRSVFGINHIYQHPTFEKMYNSDIPFDPEGLLGTLTTILVVYLGVHAGRIILTYNSPKSRIIRWILWGTLTGIIAGILCNFSKNDGAMPVNKNLWSLSYVLVTGSMAFFTLTIIYVMVDVLRKWGGRPLFYPGMNAIFLYAGHELTKNMFPWSWKPSYWSHREFLVMNLWGTFVWIAIAVFLYKKRIFLSV